MTGRPLMWFCSIVRMALVTESVGVMEKTGRDMTSCASMATSNFFKGHHGPGAATRVEPSQKRVVFSVRFGQTTGTDVLDPDQRGNRDPGLDVHFAAAVGIEMTDIDWQPIATAPFDRDLELAVVERGDTHDALALLA
jgi:hypothetical protein